MAITFPTSPSNGQQVVAGDKTYTYSSVSGTWNITGSTDPLNVLYTRTELVATADQTTFNVNYSTDYPVEVFVNGLQYLSSDYTATNGTTVVLDTGLPAGAEVVINYATATGGTNLSAVSQSIIPDANEAYDLGSADNKFRDLYLSGSTAYIGGSKIQESADGIEIKDATTNAPKKIIASEIQIGTGAEKVVLKRGTDGRFQTSSVDSEGTESTPEPVGGAISSTEPLTLASLATDPAGAPGEIFYNATEDAYKVWSVNLSTWITINPSDPPFSATGGTLYEYDGYRVHVFQSSDNFIADADGEVDVFIVAGGGGGGNLGGGGGAGGVISQSAHSVAAGTYPIVIGAGGVGGANSTAGGNGGNTTAFSLTAIGGGGGGSHANGTTAVSGGDGGSGGGGPDNYNNGYGPGSGTAGQGNDGGNGCPSYTSDPRRGGGGGGASAVGINWDLGGHGGDGVANNWINGTNMYFAGGGGASLYTSQAGGDGGLGGGGGGSTKGGAGGIGGAGYNSGDDGVSNGPGGNGGINSGGGAGGNSWDTSGLTATEKGGSGIVIVRYAS